MIRIPLDVWDAVARHCVGTAPEEAVGYLAARRDAEDDITDAVAVMNVADEPHARYAVDEHEQLEVWRLLDEQFKRVVVTYHSHVGAPAVMSAVDVEMARDSRMLHLIVSVVPSQAVPICDVNLYRVKWRDGAPVVVAPKWQCERVDGWATYKAFLPVNSPAKES